MKIWVDGQCFQTASNVRGIGRYVIDFLRALDRIDTDVQIIVSLNGRLAEEAVGARAYLEAYVPSCEIVTWYGITPEGEFHRGYCTERMTDEQILAAHINAIDPDIALSPSPFEGSVDCSAPFIKTDDIKAITACIYHDAIPYRYPDVYLKEENAEKLYMRRFAQIDSFDLVMCNSHFTESEYRDIYKRDNSVTISAGLSESFTDLIAAWAPKEDSIGALLGQNCPYALYVGGMDWRKNVPFLVRALSRVPDAMAGDLKLVLAGDNGEEFITPLRAMWEQRGLDPDNLISTGWITDAELVDLYKHAAVVLQPSRMEGFGLTALEAWACETPFLSATGGAVAEVVGAQDYLFDPDTPHALAELIGRTLHDGDFQDGQVAHGAKRLQEFSWDKTARTAYDAMQQALADAGRTPTPRGEDPQIAARSKRLIIDVSSTAQSPVLSGIQRVMYNLSDAMQTLNGQGAEQAVLSYSRDASGWYEMDALRKNALDLNPKNRLSLRDDDSYLLLDSSWTFIDGQKPRLLDAMIMGQEVVNGVHDIGPLTMSAMTDEGMPPAFRRWFEFILGYSTGIICVSRAVADEIYDVLKGINFPRPLKLGYFPLGADFADVPADPEGLDMFDDRPTFLIVGTIEPRKGHLVALRAFEQLWRDGVDVNLVIIGKAGWDTEMIVQLLENHSEAGKRLHWVRGASDGNLRAAYEKADALIMTSYLEGFGLPVVEAGRFGTPVILSDIPVFREVGEGAPWAGYFERANPADLTRVVLEFLDTPPALDSSEKESWPVWEESAQIVKDVIFDGKWHKYYEPETRLPNAIPARACDTRMTKPLTDRADRAHRMRVIEGPLLSSEAQFLRIVVAVRNDSSEIWSSTGPDSGGLAVNLSYHIYSRTGDCISYDNPRTPIPFVLLPGQEIFMPVRIPTEWLSKGATEVGLELVQEGVSWFENEQRISILNPIAASADAHMGAVDTIVSPENDLHFELCRGPFNDNLEQEKYYLFTVLNRSTSALDLTNQDGRTALSVEMLRDGIVSRSGIWIVACPDTIAPNDFGYLCVYVSNTFDEAEGDIVLQYEMPHQIERWQVDLKEGTVTFLPSEEEDLPLDSPAQIAAQIAAQPDAAPEPDALVEPSTTMYRISQQAEEPPILRGFNEPEFGHTWMQDLKGEIQIPATGEQKGKLRRIEVFGIATKHAAGPLQLTLAADGHKIGSKVISNEQFMSYSFDVEPELARRFESNRILQLESDKSGSLDEDIRKLSVAVSHIVLAYA